MMVPNLKAKRLNKGNLLIVLFFAITIMAGHAQEISSDDFFVTNNNIKIAYSISYTNDYVLKNKYIVLIHGSGRKTREYSYFKEIAVPNFAILGFSVITYDKRGCGMSSGKYEGLGVENSVNLIDKLSTDVFIYKRNCAVIFCVSER